MLLVLVSASGALTDPSGSSSLADAALWVQRAMLGTAATVIATIAVAAIGYLMMTGRVSVRRGATVVIGCFVLFGAPTIAAGIVGLVARSGEAEVAINVPAAQPVIPAAPSPTPAPAYDPYAGASVPLR